MAFVTAQPESLAAAASRLQQVGSTPLNMPRPQPR